MPGCFDDLSELLQAADFYIHPLRGELTCPLLARALAAGQSCILSKSNPLGSSLVAQEEALIFTPGNVSELTGMLKQISGDIALRQKMAAQAPRAFERIANREGQRKLLRNLLGFASHDLSGVTR